VPLSGEVGYSECMNADGVSGCPFYLGELEAASSRSMTISAKCKDGTEERLMLDNLLIALSQPAFGVAEGGTNAVGFPSGALVVDTAFDIGRDHARVRRPNRQPVVFSAGGGTFSASGLGVGFELPCNESTTDIAATVNLVDPGGGSQLAYAPEVDILIPDTVTCGSAVQLAARVEDRDDDLVSTRWMVDGVLMQKGISSMSVTEPHELALVAKDARGAATTARKVVQCN